MTNKSFVSRVFSAVWGGIDIVRKILHLLLLIFLFMVFAGTMSGGPSVLPSNAALVIQPVGVLVEQRDGDAYDRAVAELLGEAPPQTRVQDIIDALEYAKDDSRISMVHLQLGALGGAGMSKLRRIAVAIEDFKTSGKTVVASADFYSQAGYYLAAHADETYMNPDGLLLLRGFSSYTTYYKDALDLLRVDWNVFRAGTHKSYGEPYTRSEMSPEDRESRSQMIEQLWGRYVADIETARGLEEGAVADLANNLVAHVEEAGGSMAQFALNGGLVDDLLDRIALRELLKSYAGESEHDETTYSAIGMGDYLAHERLMAGSARKEENIAVVVAAGTIIDGSHPPGTIGGESTAALLRQALNDESVKAVVLRVDSGGGSTFATEVIANEVTALREAGKPVVASMGSAAASGGYWISVVADHVIASPDTITGSIGVVGMLPTYHRTLAAVGLNVDGVGTTSLSGQLRPDREMSDEMKALFQMIVDDTYSEFIGLVADARGMEVSAVDAVAQGQVWTGADALEHGLIDELGNFDDAVRIAAEMAGVSDYGLIEIESRLSPTEQMVLDFLSVVKSAGFDPAVFAIEPSPLERFASRFERALAQAAQFNDPRATYSQCFCELE